MDPDQNFPDRIRILGRSRTGLRKKSSIRIRKKPGPETLVKEVPKIKIHNRL